MVAPKIAVGLQVGTQPPLGTTRAFVMLARLMRLDSVMAIDHFRNIFPTAVWDEEFTWLAAQRPTPHEHFDYQVFLGYFASRADPPPPGPNRPGDAHPLPHDKASSHPWHRGGRAP